MNLDVTIISVNKNTTIRMASDSIGEIVDFVNEHEVAGDNVILELRTSKQDDTARVLSVLKAAFPEE